MISIFRKLRKSLIESGNTRKYLLYAIGEIALVVIGILIALQVNNLNLNRLDRNKEKLLLLEINAEFIYNKEEFVRTIQYYDRVRRNYSTLVKFFPITQKNLNLDSISALLYKTNTTFDADIFQGSITTLINSSSFDIISNSELRTLLLQWIDMVSNYKEAELLLIQFTVDKFFPYMDLHVPLKYYEGINDRRIDLSFLRTIQFENMIKRRNILINNMISISENKNAHIIKTIDRIVKLSSVDQK